MVGPLFVDQSLWWTGQSALRASSILFDDDVRRGLGTSASNLTSTAPHIPQASVTSSQDHNLLFFVSSAPALVACCVLFCRALHFVPYRPRWLQPFVNEHDECPKLLGDDDSGKGGPQLLNRLLVLSALGIVTQIVVTLLPVQDLTSIPRVLAWVSYLVYHSYIVQLY